MIEINRRPPGVEKRPLIPPVTPVTPARSGQKYTEDEERPPHDSGLAETLELQGQERRRFLVTDSTTPYGPNAKPTRALKILTKLQAEALGMEWEDGEKIEP